MDPKAALNLASAFTANAVRRQGLQPLTQAQQKIAAVVQPAIDRAMVEEGAACKSGCCWCCYRPIPLTIIEAAAIVQHVVETWSPEHQRELNERLRNYEHETRLMRANPLEAIRVQCPFLKEDMCSIYEVRPWMCRSQASTDVEACKAWKESHYERVPIEKPGIVGPPGKFMALRLTKRPRIESCDALGEATLDGILGGANSAGVQLGFLELGLAIRPQLAKSPALKDVPYDSETQIAAWAEGFHPRLSEPTGYRDADPKVMEAMEALRNIPASKKPLPTSGMDPQIAMAMLQTKIEPDSEDEILEIRAHYEKVLDRLLDIELDSPAVFGTLDAHAATTIPFFGFVDRDLNAKFGAFVTRHSAHAIPDLNEPLSKRKPGAKLKIGFISGTMRNHNGSRWALGYLLNKPQDIEVYAFHTGTEEDFVTEIWRSRADHFFKLQGSVPEAARFVKSLGLDALVFPDPFEFSNVKQFATFKLAPIQAAMWGSPYTTGFPNMTHFLSSDAMEPENAQEHYSEQLIRLPRSGLCFENWLTYPGGEFDKGLLGQGPHFFLPQNPQNYLPRRDALFKRVAEEIGRPLIAIDFGTLASKRLQQRWEEKGIAVKWLPSMSASEFAGLMEVVDAALNTHDWSGGNTTLQALAVGTPVICMPGIHMRGRHTLGFYKVLGAENLIAVDENDYISKAKDAGAMREEIKKLPVDSLFDDSATAVSFFEILRELNSA